MYANKIDDIMSEDLHSNVFFPQSEAVQNAKYYIVLYLFTMPHF